MINPSADVELYLRKTLPTGDSVTRGPLRAAVTVDQDDQFELAVAAATEGEQIAATANMLTNLLMALSELLGRSPGDLAVMAAAEVFAHRGGRGGGTDE
nr:MAG TPA: hypothetical protein [Caudoviricetes sp.]